MRWILDFEFGGWRLVADGKKIEELDFSLLVPPTRILYQRKWLIGGLGGRVIFVGMREGGPL